MLFVTIGVICNYFYTLKDGNNNYLLDGFNRLFTNELNIDDEQIVYIKQITSKLSDEHLMNIMFKLNLWKLHSSRFENYDTELFFDKGMRLLLYKKYNITIHKCDDFNISARNINDFRVLNDYFIDETRMGVFNYGYLTINKLFLNPQIINNIKQIIQINDYKEPLFKNYYRFVSGFIMYLNRERIKGKISEYIFEEYLNELKSDKFYKKLQKMSWTDSTRKSVYNYFKGKYE